MVRLSPIYIVECRIKYWNHNFFFFFFVHFAEANFPRFAEPIPNITVTVGRDALLACVVDNLKGYKVSSGQGFVAQWKFCFSCCDAR